MEYIPIILLGIMLIVFVMNEIRFNNEILDLNNNILDLSFKSIQIADDYRKNLDAIKDILKNADIAHENYIVTLDKIKEVVKFNNNS